MIKSYIKQQLAANSELFKEDDSVGKNQLKLFETTNSIQTEITFEEKKKSST